MTFGEKGASGYAAEKGYRMIQYAPSQSIGSPGTTALFIVVGATTLFIPLYSSIWSCWSLEEARTH
jgi:hypothetical protein